ncbi:MAG: ABC transporter ATP-binding protein [bacterium]|nr:ABC transporter ATP-binding protein [bacterium]
MKKITYYIKKYWYFYAFAIASMVISISLDMLSPMITQSIVDNVLVGGNMSLLPKLLLGILAIGIGRCIFQYTKETTFDIVSNKISIHLRTNLFQYIQKLDISFFDDVSTGELMARVKDDIDKIWNVLGFVGMLLIEVTIHTVFVLFCMYRISPALAVIPTLVLPIVGTLAIVMERKLGKIYGEISEENAVLNTVAEENLSGVRTVKAFAREKYEIKKFLSHNNRYYELNMKQSKVFVRFYPYFQMVTKLLPFTVLLFGGYLYINNTLSLGQLSAFTEYSMNIVWPMEMLGWLTNEFSSALASNKKIEKIYENAPKIQDAEDAVTLPVVKGEISFDHVCFFHNGKQILKDISFHISPGKTIGIMGATGAGKSSIINLLERLYDVDSGEIRLDQVNIKKLKLQQLRTSISLVMQDVFLFSDTVFENIKLGKRKNLNPNDVRAAAKQAEADSFISKMDSDYETIIGERGVGLSGGQKQRISIARALSKHAPILVLDDSTSALDMETEHNIQKNLASLQKTTKLIIAHRISAVRNADEIIYLEDGQIVERGTHEELLKLRGLYYETYKTQYGDIAKQVSVS